MWQADLSLGLNVRFSHHRGTRKTRDEVEKEDGGKCISTMTYIFSRLVLVEQLRLNSILWLESMLGYGA